MTTDEMVAEGKALVEATAYTLSMFVTPKYQEDFKDALVRFSQAVTSSTIATYLQMQETK